MTPDVYETVRKTVAALRAQTLRDCLELVLVAPSAAELEPDDRDLGEFGSVRIVEVGELTSTGRARAAGVRAASAPVVAFAEDHSYPEPEWAEALLRAHGNGWTAVGPDILNANPESMLSWADLVLAGRTIDPERAGVVRSLPGRNSSYKRDVLLAYGDELDALIEMETLLHWELQTKGHELYLETAARTAHVNHARLPDFVREQFYVGWVIAAMRSRSWSRRRRVLYAVTAPLIPAVRTRRIAPPLRRAARTRDLLPGVLPPIALGLVVATAGELLGYALGLRGAGRRIVDVEFHRNGA